MASTITTLAHGHGNEPTTPMTAEPMTPASTTGAPARDRKKFLDSRVDVCTWGWRLMGIEPFFLSCRATVVAKKRKFGQIQLRVTYTSATAMLQVTVGSVAKLQEADQPMDLYVKFRLVPGDKKLTKASATDAIRRPGNLSLTSAHCFPTCASGPEQRKTAVAKQTLEPAFNETLTWPIDAADIGVFKLTIALCQEGKISNDVLSEVRAHMAVHLGVNHAADTPLAASNSCRGGCRRRSPWT